MGEACKMIAALLDNVDERGNRTQPMWTQDGMEIWSRAEAIRSAINDDTRASHVMRFIVNDCVYDILRAASRMEHAIRAAVRNEQEGDDA